MDDVVAIGNAGNRTVTIENARIVTPHAYVQGGVAIDGDRIAAVGSVPGARRADERIDARGRLVLPGLIDLHGDDVERHLFPRTDSRVDAFTALTAADRATLAAGITTKFHAIAFEDAPDENRTIDLSRDLVDAFGTTRLLADHRIHARCELATDSLDATLGIVRDGRADLVSVMHHVPGEGQFDDRSGLVAHYVDDRGDDPDRAARRVDERLRTDDADLTARLRRVATAVDETGVPLASHDDGTSARVERMARHGATISEFPTRLAAARRADDLGLTTVMGAPNLVRGGSLWGNLAAGDAAAAGVLDVLCSDYHPPSLLAAAFVDTGEPLTERVARVTSAPADAVGMDDRGRIEPGARADLVLVDPDPGPTVDRAFVAGSEVYRATPGRRESPSSPHVRP
ncbi:MAG: alpha-D-ribose 1-methylphosphonate 5-triphosphate diphosphatase [Haloferacaceae archaeon]